MHQTPSETVSAHHCWHWLQHGFANVSACSVASEISFHTQHRSTSSHGFCKIMINLSLVSSAWDHKPSKGQIRPERGPL